MYLIVVDEGDQEIRAEYPRLKDAREYYDRMVSSGVIFSAVLAHVAASGRVAVLAKWEHAE